MSKPSDDVAVVRAPRKQAHPYQAPSSNDLVPGRVFTVAFGMSGPRIGDVQPDRSGYRRAPSTSPTTDSEGSTGSDPSNVNTDSQTGQRFMATDRLEYPVILQPRVNSDQLRKAPSRSSSTIDSKPKPLSLAGLYLDTMIMDDAWRAACLRKIRQNQRKHATVKRANIKPKHPSHYSSSVPTPKDSKVDKKPTRSVVKSKKAPPTPPISPKNQSRTKPSSPEGSDSGFVSSSPSPRLPSYFRVRSTRNYPINVPVETISLDISASMVGRSCLSCGCTTTTCWRRTLGGIICNSCGLRYKKCGIICADAKCRYIPTRSEIRELKGQTGDMRKRGCYACRGKVLFHDDDVERHE